MLLFKEVCPTEMRVYGLKTQGRRNGGSPNQASYSKSVAHISCWADGLRPGVFWEKQNGGSRKFDFDPEGRPKSQVASTTQKENEVIEHADFIPSKKKSMQISASIEQNLLRCMHHGIFILLVFSLATSLQPALKK